MAFDQNTRNRLARFVTDARTLLTEEFTRQLQRNYGIDPTSGEVTAVDRLAGISDAERQTAELLRETAEHYLPSFARLPAKSRRDTIERIVREQAFTVLNRLCALRMAEARGLLIESIAAGYQSRGFQLYARLAGAALGETGDAYRTYLFSLFDEFAVDLPVLFDRFAPEGRLFPGETVLLALLDLVNHPEIERLWAEDETIGWIYQYFNSKEERKAMRDASAAPRNSRELAVRNQFFTPRYVVEFLTDNTLGRIWYEMTKGETSLKETCRYLVRRPNEIFLAAGEKAPEQQDTPENLSQEELLKQPIYIPHRPLKDPRAITMLDPACGSMHFGLYAFDLFERIYEEAWELEGERGPKALERAPMDAPLHEAYPDKDSFLRDVPRLIVERNIHGVDIDPRAVQIAGLSLWLRAQKSWREQSLKPQERPQIRRSNVVCAEPMPGDKDLLEEFIAKHLSSNAEDKVVAWMLRKVFDAMTLAGEAGSLLKIEDEITTIVAEAKRQWRQGPKLAQSTFFADEAERITQRALDLDASGITDATFWIRAEERIDAALKDYATFAEGEGAYRRRLFAGDATRGFAFIDLCRKRYDVVLMNPPFGEPAVNSLKVWSSYPKDTPKNIYAVFMVRAANLIKSDGGFGAISDSTYLKQPSFLATRETLLSEASPLYALVDLGWNVLDANVRTALSVVLRPSMRRFWALNVSDEDERELVIQRAINDVSPRAEWKRHVDVLELPKSVFALDLTRKAGRELISMQSLGEICDLPWGCGANDSFQLFRLRWEVSPIDLNRQWSFLTNGGSFSPFYRENFLVCKSRMENGDSAFTTSFRNGTDKLYDAAAQELYFKLGLTYPKRTEFFHVSLLPQGHVFTPEGKGLFIEESGQIWFYLGLLNSSFIASVASIVCGPHKQRGDVELIKIPLVRSSDMQIIEHEAKAIFEIARQLMPGEESSTLFISPNHPIALSEETNLNNVFSRHIAALSKVRSSVSTRMDKIDAVVAASVPTELKGMAKYGDLLEERGKLWADLSYNIETIISYLLGTTYGRWDIRHATSEKPAPDLPDPFAPLPVCPPGMLQNDAGLPAAPAEVPASYPLRISWLGILVDDEGHPEDIESRVREAIKVIWGERAEAIEQEACEILGVRSLREYFRKPASFFADHLQRYSKSRRQAPIYWPLSTPSGNYTIWLYYHRLTDQTLYSCVNDFVEPKLAQVSEQAAALRRKTGRTGKEEKELERLTDLELELQDFRAELLRVAAFWKPNLSDGVQITAAPLWKLFQHKPWQKRLKETWEKLEAGEYDWAHLSYSIWPERVRAKCKTDKSLAIAHDLEALYVEPPAGAKKGRGKKAVEDEGMFGEE